MNDGTFKVGEIACFKDLQGAFRHLNGEECEVRETQRLRPVVDLHGTASQEFVYVVNYRGLFCAVPGDKLRKKPDSPKTMAENLLISISKKAAEHDRKADLVGA